MNISSLKEQQGLVRLMVILSTDGDQVIGSLEKTAMRSWMDHTYRILKDLEAAHAEIAKLKTSLERMEQ